MQFSTNLVTFTEEILNGKLHFLCSVLYVQSFEESSAIEHFILLNIFFLKTCQITEIVPKHYLQTALCHTLGKSCTSLYGLATDII